MRAHLPTPPVDWPTTSGRFEAWAIERTQLEIALDDTPEDEDPAARERLLDRAFELEKLILTTPSFALAAMRVKADALAWLMQMDGSDGSIAMRQIRDFLATLSEPEQL